MKSYIFVLLLCYAFISYKKKTEQGNEKSLSLKGSIGMNKLSINIE